MTTHATISADSLYWAVLDTSSLPPASGAKHREQLGFLFERFLPRPIEQVQAVYQPIAKDSVLACGIDRERLREINAITLTPDSIPAFRKDRCDRPNSVHELNLLIGDFEPRQVRQLRRRWLAHLTAAAALAFAMLLVGVERRVQAATATVDNVTIAIEDLHAQTLGPSPNGGPQFSRMIGELRQLRRTRRGNSDLMPRDPAPALAAWLTQWPPDPPARTSSLIATEGSMSLTTNVTSNDDAQTIISAMNAPRGWNIAQPRLTAAADSVRLTLRVEREEGP